MLAFTQESQKESNKEESTTMTVQPIYIGPGEYRRKIAWQNQPHCSIRIRNINPAHPFTVPRLHPSTSHACNVQRSTNVLGFYHRVRLLFVFLN